MNQTKPNKPPNERPISIPLNFDDAMEAFISVAPPKQEDKQKKNINLDEKKPKK